MYTKLKANASSNTMRMINKSNILDVITQEASDRKSKDSTECSDSEPEFFYGLLPNFFDKIGAINKYLKWYE
jgi:hypothetical protein